MVVSQDKVVLRRTLKATPEQLFDAFSKADALMAWHAPEGMVTPIAEADLRIGGAYRITMEQTAESPMGPAGARHTVRGVYREIDRPRKLVFTWAWDKEEGAPEFMGDETLVTIEFRATEGGNTELVLTHELLKTEESRASHEQGWTSVLNKLEQYIGGR